MKKEKNGRRKRTKQCVENIFSYSQLSRRMSEDDRREITNPTVYIWLDAAFKTGKTNNGIVTQIEKIILNRLQTFFEPDPCVDYITDEAVAQKTYLIISNNLGKSVVPVIYDLPQIEAIYIYCSNKQAAEEWATPNLKVRGIFTKNKPLLEQIRRDARTCFVEDSLPITAFQVQEQQNSVHKLSPTSSKFMWYRFLMNVLPLMAKHFNAKDEMVEEALKRYEGDEVEKKRIRDFAVTYREEKAFWWYTLPAFAYRLLNDALRTQNIDIIFKFRFLIHDLHKQIQELYRKYLLTHTGNHSRLYRGQFLSIQEIEFLKGNVNGLIAMNTFLSTTRLVEVAQRFFNLDDSVPDSSSEQSVLFIIDIDQINDETTPFAFIEEFSCNPDEAEMLFTINAIFQVMSVERQGRIWHVNLQVAQPQNQERRDLMTYMTNAIGSEPNPTVFGWFLYRMHDYERANQYVDYIIKQNMLEGAEAAAVYNLLGLIHHDCKDYRNAIEHFQTAIHIYDETARVGGAQIISIHRNLCLAYLKIGDTRSAEDTRRRIDELLTGANVKDNLLMIAISDDVRGKIEAAYGNLAKALENLDMALTRKKTELPPNHPSLAGSHHSIGVIHARMGHDEEALEHFQKAAEIGVQSLLADDFQLAEYYADLGRIHYKRKAYKLALEQLEKALKIITDATQEDKDIITDILQCIKEINDIIEPLSPRES